MESVCLRDHERVGALLLASNNIWPAIETLTNEFGMKVGQHLEVLLCRELGRAREDERELMAVAK